MAVAVAAARWNDDELGQPLAEAAQEGPNEVLLNVRLEKNDAVCAWTAQRYRCSASVEQRSCIYRLRSAETVQSQEVLSQANEYVNEKANEQASASNIHFTWLGRARPRQA